MTGNHVAALLLGVSFLLWGSCLAGRDVGIDRVLRPACDKACSEHGGVLLLSDDRAACVCKDYTAFRQDLSKLYQKAGDHGE